MTAIGFWHPVAAASGYPADLDGLVVVEAGYQGSATAGTYSIGINWRWGIDGGGDPYFNSTGVTAGHEAILAVDPTTGTHYLVPVTI